MCVQVLHVVCGYTSMWVHVCMEARSNLSGMPLGAVQRFMFLRQRLSLAWNLLSSLVLLVEPHGFSLSSLPQGWPDRHTHHTQRFY